MNQVLSTLYAHRTDLLFPSLWFLAILAVGYVTRRLLFLWVDRWSKQRKRPIDPGVIDAVRAPFMLWVGIFGLHIAVLNADLNPRILGYVSKTLVVLWIVALTMALSRLVAAAIRGYSKAGESGLGVTTLSQNLARSVIVVMGAMIVLNAFGVTVAPLLTALGVGGIAVALALQDTLANLFAGIYMSLAGQVRMGDYVRLDGGQVEGYVTDVNWRTSTLRSLDRNYFVIPNAKLAQATLANFTVRDRELRVRVNVSASYAADPRHVTRVLIEVGAAEDIPGLSNHAPPTARVLSFDDSSISYALLIWVDEFESQFAVLSELRARIWHRFREEGIEIPFPIRTVIMRNPE
ncbi:MAG: mechanosensitive ion channel family protein [Bryobacteraceae bacterium]